MKNYTLRKYGCPGCGVAVGEQHLRFCTWANATKV